MKTVIIFVYTYQSSFPSFAYTCILVFVIRIFFPEVVKLYIFFQRHVCLIILTLHAQLINYSTQVPNMPIFIPFQWKIKTRSEFFHIFYCTTGVLSVKMSSNNTYLYYCTYETYNRDQNSELSNKRNLATNHKK